MISFIPVTEEHRALLQSWLIQPHWREWWGDPVEELAMIYAVDQGEHLPFIARINDEPIAYIQCWWPAQNPDVPWVKDMKMTERGIDISIGQAVNLGKGLGTMIVKAFSAKLFAEGATRLLIDPDKNNTRAIAAYIKAGFTPYAEFEGDLLMELSADDMTWMENL